MKVRIICGSYGYRTKYGVKPVMLGETCEVDGMEAGRLVGLGIAEIVDAPASPSAAAPAQAAAEQEYIVGMLLFWMQREMTSPLPGSRR